MSLTYQEIWARYSHVEFVRRIYIKRLNVDGTYEAAWTEISQGMTKDGSVNSISRSLPNDSWQFGFVTVNNVSLEILSPYQEFSGENDPNSIFFGYVRHKSKMKVVDAFVDKYTDPTTPTESSVTTFEGLIDATTAQTEQGYEKCTMLDYISVLDDVNVAELALAQTSINALVYEILNRAGFTKYFNVSNSTTYINAGYNASSIDLTKYTGSVLEMLQDLAKGHSIFYVDPTDGYFYFKPADPTATTQYSFLESNNRKLDISAWRDGINRQVTSWFWDEEDAGISAVASPAPVNSISSRMKIDGITNATQRQNLLNYVLTRTQYAKPYFKLVLPYFPVIKLLDRVSVQSFGSAPKDALRWGMFAWTDGDTTNPNVAPRWRKPAGIRISADDEWMVRSISHDSSLKTTVELEKIL
jgi:hypothetical protein